LPRARAPVKILSRKASSTPGNSFQSAEGESPLSFHSDRDKIGDTTLAYEHIHMKAWHPEEKEVVRFLRIVATPGRTPVLVHCQHGAKRTGALCAIYRIAVEGWSKEEAITEMVAGGFGYHDTWINLPRWIRTLDIDQVRDEAGITL